MMLRLIACSLVLTCLGCGGRAFEMAPVAGTVTLDGQSLADAKVVFQPMAAEGTTDAGAGSVGTTDASGKFTLTCVDDRPGAVVGKHRVSISTYKGDETAEGMVTIAEEKVPEKYNEETTLTFEVPSGGTDAANFDLTSS